MTVRVHAIVEDGLPDMDKLTGRVAFLWDGEIISGWPLKCDCGEGFDPCPCDDDEQRWEPAEDRFGGPLAGVTHWVEFPVSLWNIATLHDDEIVWDIAMAHAHG